jgi:Flp pilus assembly pilin Flp
VLPKLIRLQLLVRHAFTRVSDERGQTSAEYALVLLGAASVALLIAVWAKDTNKIGKLLDAIFDSITKLVK